MISASQVLLAVAPLCFDPQLTEARTNPVLRAWETYRMLTLRLQYRRHDLHQCTTTNAGRWGHLGCDLPTCSLKYPFLDMTWVYNRRLSSARDQVVIFLVRSDIPFIQSGLASLAPHRIFINTLEASWAISPLTVKSLSTSDPSGK